MAKKIKVAPKAPVVSEKCRNASCDYCGKPGLKEVPFVYCDDHCRDQHQAGL